MRARPCALASLSSLCDLRLQRDLARRGVAVRRSRPCAAAQVRQQLHLRVVADASLGAVDLDARLVELRQQPLDRDLQYLGKLSNRHFRHTLLDPQALAGPLRTNARAPP